MKTGGLVAISTLISTRFIVTYLLIVGLVLIFANHVAPANRAPLLAKVIVDVTSENHQAIIESYLLRSLRKLDDVKIVNDLDSDALAFRIEVVHMQRESGLHILSTIIQGFIPPSNLKNPAYRSNVLRPCVVWNHLLHSGGSDGGLHSYCEEVIAKFDTMALEVWRLEQSTIQGTDELINILDKINKHLDGQANR